MQREDIDIYKLFEFHPNDGSIFFKGCRILLFNASILSLIKQIIVGYTGIENARKSICRLAYKQGFESYITVERQFGKTQEGSIIGPRFYEVTGFAQCETISVHEGQNPPTFSILTYMFNSIEADNYLATNNKLSSIPVCWWATGFTSGYCSAAFDLEIYHKELKCAACGGQYCELEGHDVSLWPMEDTIAFRELYGFSDEADAKNFRDMLRDCYKNRHMGKNGNTVVVHQAEKKFKQHIIAAFAAKNGIVIESEKMLSVMEQAISVSKLNIPILIEGESGTGKDFVANFLHQQSARCAQEMVSVNCAALSETLLESEIFGHVKGAFTGAVADKAGLFETASKSTLFLDEIGEMPLSAQAKLLRTLENGEVRRLGSTKNIYINPRIIAATNKDLRLMVEKGAFREDLYFRLNAFIINSPALRDRIECIPFLINHFLKRISETFGKKVDTVAPEAMQVLVAYSWPGNIRELKHSIERAAVVADGSVIRFCDLTPEITGNACLEQHKSEFETLCQDMEQNEKTTIIHALNQHNGNRMATASALNINVSTLWRKMRKYELF